MPFKNLFSSASLGPSSVLYVYEISVDVFKVIFLFGLCFRLLEQFRHDLIWNRFLSLSNERAHLLVTAC